MQEHPCSLSSQVLGKERGKHTLATTESSVPGLSTGIAGLDEVMGGGLPPNRLYLIQGDPGVGKTTLALQFLLDGLERGERVLYVTLSETSEELASVASSHGWSLEGIELYELSAAEEFLKPDSIQTVYRSSEVELTETIERIFKIVEDIKPTRAVFDSLSELRLLARDPLRYRRQILALKQFFVGRNCTVVLLDDRTSEASDLQLQSIVHGVITLEQIPPSYGIDRRRLRIQKLRGVNFRSGYHDFLMQTGGLKVFPRLVAAEHRRPFAAECISSGIKGLDSLLGGGLDRGVSNLLLGPAGSGKSTLAVQYACAAAARGEHACIYAFEEAPRTLFTRSEALKQPLQEYVNSGLIAIRQVDPAELTPGEFSNLVRASVEEDNARVVVIDSLNGFLNAMPEDRFLLLQLHELLTYLGEKGVTSILVMAQHGMIGPAMATPVDVSYIADTVLLFRYYEYSGTIKQALSVVKRRSGVHERTIRELTLSSDTGIEIGPALDEFRGVLTGVPIYAPSANGAEAT